ncbi:hypothetical protein [Brucella pseudogrignonensis]|nr:hypothetical protein [Brucella pseudogrignonensis]MQP38764.1 hypothetical protein [Ochrobactrum sp. MYb237]
MASSKLTEATCFCSLGAIGAILGAERGFTEHSRAELMLEPAWTDATGEVASFNDHPMTTHADVLRMFNRAIRHAEAWEALALTH